MFKCDVLLAAMTLAKTRHAMLKLQLFDGLTSQWRQFSLNKDSGCSVCSTG
ncbi:hypothetical protein [Rheinheimera baltica]|uniref:hypothetical protein n=1 Tax=Rheinheimera baltica TaxID=67576 RepID=UPI00273F74A9|nr:hypothetical protein [Rheinheimera baltica]MDP5191623.1 hypothetical protein [Rheinheimera baltica]